MCYISDEDLMCMVPLHRTRSTVHDIVEAFRGTYFACDVLVMGPDGGFHECKNRNGTPIEVEQASRLVRDRIVQLLL